ncbi:long-chain-fatty-acid--CoA ligase [Lachnospiraceae bacterium]|nr:long-chain-fatty-acid--CoA ligase [Lachnospiraceae bacterium]
MWEFLKRKFNLYNEALFCDKGRKYTYEQIKDMVIRHGENLKKNLDPQAKCAVLCQKGLDCSLGIMACWYAEMIPIPLSINYGYDHCKKIIELTNPDLLITDHNLDFMGFRYDIIEGKFAGNVLKIQSEDGLQEIALIMCTSGTTGTPKGVMIGSKELKDNVSKIAEYFDININDTILIARPLYHCAVLTGEFLSAINKGLNIVFFDEKYNPNSVLKYAIKSDATVLCGTPTLFNHISACIRRSHVKHQIKKIVLSGECLNKKTALDIRNSFPETMIYNVYGLTEASPRVSWLSPEKFDIYPESVGTALNGIEIKVLDEQGNEQSANIHGYISVKTPCLMKGYYKNKRATQEAIIDGWLNTGDVGYKDQEGNLFILSRADDMIIKGGMNIYPKEIEDQIIKINQIEECVAYGKRGEVGENIAVDVVLKCSGEKLISKKELAALMSNVLPSYQMPSEINIVDTLKRNASGKIVRMRK